VKLVKNPLRQHQIEVVCPFRAHLTPRFPAPRPACLRGGDMNAYVSVHIP